MEEKRITTFEANAILHIGYHSYLINSLTQKPSHHGMSGFNAVPFTRNGASTHTFIGGKTVFPYERMVYPLEIPYFIELIQFQTYNITMSEDAITMEMERYSDNEES